MFFSETTLKTFLRFVEQIAQLHGVAAAGFERLAVLAHDFTTSMNKFSPF